jgi:AraC-like DNA-binding protein
MPSAPPLDRFPLVRSQSAEEICAALARVYARPTLHVEGNTKHIDAVFNLYQMTDVRLGYTRYGIPIGLFYPESDVVLQTLPMRGQGEAVIKDVAYPLDAGCGLTMTPGESVAVRLNANYEHLILLMNAAALNAKLAAITGASTDLPLRFHPLRDDTSAPGKAFRDHFAFLVNAVSRSPVPLPKLVLTEFEQVLMVMSLHANQHNYSHLLAQASPDGALPQVRRAEEYIEANWQQALTLESLAQVSGMSALALFRTFKKTRGYSPLEFANQVRLQHARARLRQPEAATTVATVALSCGFADVRRFVEDYGAAFGEHPSQTLDRNGPGSMI